jgi:hypothetical protein
MRYAFRIPIGDWSGDGHGEVIWYDATAAKPIEDVREAYFAAKKKLPAACCPESFCSAYQECEMDNTSRMALRKAGAPLSKKTDMEPDAMAAIVVWFINQGDAAVDVRLDGAAPPMLPFYGHDKRKRHIGFIGYGLFD